MTQAIWTFCPCSPEDLEVRQRNSCISDLSEFPEFLFRNGL